MNPKKLMDRLNMGAMSQLGKVLESIHAYLERILEENEKQTKILEKICDNSCRDRDKHNIADVPVLDRD